MISYEKFKKNIVKTVEEIKINSGLDISNVRVLCPICGGRFWGNKKYKHMISIKHQKSLNVFITNNNYDKNINKDIFIVDIGFWQ